MSGLGGIDWQLIGLIAGGLIGGIGVIAIVLVILCIWLVASEPNSDFWWDREREE